MTRDWIDEAIAQLRRTAEAEYAQGLPQDGPRAQLVLRVLGWLCYGGAGAIVVLYLIKLLGGP